MNNLKQLAFQMKWQFVIMYRNNLVGISIGVTAIYACIFFLFKDMDHTDKVLTLLLYNDPSLIGLIFFGLAVILEKNQQVLPAFFVTPMSIHHYLLARVLCLAIIGWACALGMILSALGFSFHFLHFSVGVFAICFLLSMGGIFLISYTSEFLTYMLLSIPIMFLFSLPLLNYYGLTDIVLFKLCPTQGAMDLIVGSYENALPMKDALIAYATTIAWSIGLYLFSYKIFYKKMRAEA